MPPPNQTTGSPPAGSAASMRTFMCTVGTYGLRGWNTSETPIASNGAPASSGRCCVADGGSAAPRTCEKLQPPRSSSAPSSTRRERPSPSSAPPGSRARRRAGTASPSSASQRRDDALLQAEQVVADRARSVIAASQRLIARWPMSRAVLRAVEADAAQHLVGALLRQPRRVAERGDAQHAAAAGDAAAVAAARVPAWNTCSVVAGLAAGRPVIASPLRGVGRIAVRRPSRRRARRGGPTAARPGRACRRWRCISTSNRSLFSRIRIGCASGSPRRQLNSTVLRRALRVDHQAGVEEAGERDAVGAPCRRSSAGRSRASPARARSA